ncbi:hypothetical protein [Mycoplasma anserisalpingitidis]|uniref:hypothetical protein n=1 Tax=Mycoplasma anserisalpingitidis TaxID=519450 RepID=UPI001CF6839F|nr:hypothetical protein [Mycoplasma anserisalpingitidis]UCU26662.1 hypothetical protein K7D06_03655 [Mycoplasma anserisalpingitidis]UCU27500.1 hypothetical protein K9O38_00445 [Mycoplasma anserisalpingitidis]
MITNDKQVKWAILTKIVFYPIIVISAIILIIFTLLKLNFNNEYNANQFWANLFLVLILASAIAWFSFRTFINIRLVILSKRNKIILGNEEFSNLYLTDNFKKFVQNQKFLIAKVVLFILFFALWLSPTTVFLIILSFEMPIYLILFILSFVFWLLTIKKINKLITLIVAKENINISSKIEKIKKYYIYSNFKFNNIKKWKLSNIQKNID